MHWLSGKPCDLSNHIHMVGAKGKEQDIFSEFGKQNWETILLHRSRELKPGGRMVLVNFGIDEEGRYLGNTSGINMFDTFNEIWKEFLEDGRITEEEYLRMTLPKYYNTVEEFFNPLVEVDHPSINQAFVWEISIPQSFHVLLLKNSKPMATGSDSRMITFPPSEVGMKASSLEPLKIPVLQRTKRI